jgi:hypothetical protein
MCGDNMDSKTTTQIFLFHAPPIPCVLQHAGLRVEHDYRLGYVVDLLLTKAFFRSDVVILVQF